MGTGAEIEIEIEHTLSDEEKNEVAKEGIRLSDEHDKLIEAFKDDRAIWRSKIKTAKAARDEKHKAYMTGTERRKIMCVEHINLEEKKAQYIHLGKIVRERDLTIEEMEDHGTAPLFAVEPTSEIQDVVRAETSRNKKDVVTSVQ